MSRLTDDECSLWFCERCGESGALYVKGADVYSVVNEIARNHQLKSSHCAAAAGQLRIARPDSWYKDTRTNEAY